MSINRDQIREDLLKFQVNCHLNDLNVNIPDPRKIQAKLIECYDYQRRTSIYYNQIRPIITTMKNQLELEKYNVNVRRRDIIINVSSVKSLPSLRERELATEAMLDNENKKLLEIQNQINVYEDLFDATNMTLKQLKTAEMNIKLLIRVMETQIEKLNVGTVDDPEVSSLTKNLSDIDNMVNFSDEIGLEDDVESSKEYLQSEDIDILGAKSDGASDSESRGVDEEEVDDDVTARGVPKDGIAHSEGAIQTGVIGNVLSDFNGEVPKSTQSETPVPTEDASIDLTELFSGEDISDSEATDEEESVVESVAESPIDGITNTLDTKSTEVVMKKISSETTEGPVKQVIVDDLDIDLSELISSKGIKPKTEDTAVSKPVESSRVKNSGKTIPKQQEKPKVVEDDASISSIDFDLDALLKS